MFSSFYNTYFFSTQRPFYLSNKATFLFKGLNFHHWHNIRLLICYVEVAYFLKNFSDLFTDLTCFPMGIFCPCLNDGLQHCLLYDEVENVSAIRHSNSKFRISSQFLTARKFAGGKFFSLKDLMQNFVTFLC